MENNLNDSILIVCAALNKHSVQYMIVDFLPELKALSKFRSSFKKKEVVNLKETEIPFINYDDLIQDKKANFRDKDIIDIEQLKNKKKITD